jgi:hypothetical protein
MLNRLVYYSERDRACTDEDVARLIARSAARNRGVDVTGLLVADRDCFVQILEGPRTAVSVVFQDVCRDPRHRNVVIAECSEIEQLSCPRWGMARLTDPAKVGAAWGRVARRGVFAPWPLNALQLRALLRIAMGDAISVPRDAAFAAA